MCKQNMPFSSQGGKKSLGGKFITFWLLHNQKKRFLHHPYLLRYRFVEIILNSNKPCLDMGKHYFSSFEDFILCIRSEFLNLGNTDLWPLLWGLPGHSKTLSTPGFSATLCHKCATLSYIVNIKWQHNPTFIKAGYR